MPPALVSALLSTAVRGPLRDPMRTPPSTNAPSAAASREAKTPIAVVPSRIALLACASFSDARKLRGGSRHVPAGVRRALPLKRRLANFRLQNGIPRPMIRAVRKRDWDTLRRVVLTPLAVIRQLVRAIVVPFGHPLVSLAAFRRLPLVGPCRCSGEPRDFSLSLSQPRRVFRVSATRDDVIYWPFWAYLALSLIHIREQALPADRAKIAEVFLNVWNDTLDRDVECDTRRDTNRNRSAKWADKLALHFASQFDGERYRVLWSANTKNRE